MLSSQRAVLETEAHFHTQFPQGLGIQVFYFQPQYIHRAGIRFQQTGNDLDQYGFTGTERPVPLRSRPCAHPGQHPAIRDYRQRI